MTPRTKRRAAILLAAITASGLAVSGLYLANESKKARTAREGLEQGRAALERGDHEAAMVGLGKYVARHRDDPDAVLLLAEARRAVPMENGRHLIQAAAMARSAAELAPDKIAPLEMLLELYPSMGFVNETLTTADAILKLQPAHLDALRARAAGLTALGRLAEALEAARQLAAAAPADTNAHRHVVALMYRSERPKAEILAYADQVAKARPEDAQVAVLQAQAAALTGETQAAVAAAQRAATLRITTAEELSSVLQVLEQLRLAGEADALMARLAKDPSLTREVALVAAQRAWKVGDNATAREAIRAAVPAVRDATDEALGWCALVHQTSGEPIGAEAAAELRRRASADARGWVSLLDAAQAITDERYAAAAEALAFPSSQLRPLALHLRGKANLGLGDWRSAADAWQELVSADPTWRATRLSLAALLLDHGIPDAAYEQAHAAFAIRPGYAEGLTLAEASLAMLASGRAAAVDLPATRSLIAQIVEQVPDQPAGHILQIRLMLHDRDIPAAEAATQRLLEAHKDALGPGHYLLLARAWRDHDPVKTSEIIILAREAAPDEPDVAYAAAVSFAQADQIEAAERLLRDGIARAPEGEPQLQWRLRLAMLLDHFAPERGKELLAQIASEQSRNVHVQLAVLESVSAWSDAAIIAGAASRLRDLLGEGSSLWRMYEARRLLTFNPSEAQAAKAIDLLRTVVGSGRAPTSALGLYADAWMLLGDRTRAIDSLARAADAEPATAALYPELVALLQESGRTTDAESRLLAFLEVENLPPRLRRIRAELLAAQGMRQEAGADLEALAAAGEPQDVLALAVFEARGGRAARAATLFEQLLAAEHPDARTLITAADFYAGQGDFERGLKLFDRLPAEVTPDQRNAIVGSYLNRNGQPEQAEALFVEAAKSGRPDAVAVLAEFYIARGRGQEAAAVLAPAVQAHPDDANLARLDAIARLASVDQVSPEHLNRLLPLLANSQSPEPVREIVEAMRTLSENPNDTETYITKLQQITQRHPRFYPAWAQLVVALRSAGKPQEAGNVARTAARMNPGDPRPARLATDAFLAAGKFEDARLAALDWRERSLADPLDADVVLARIELALNDAPAAARRLEPHVRRVTERLDANPAAAQALALALASTGRSDDAHQMLWAKAQSDPNWAMLYLQVARQAALPDATRRDWIRRVEPLLSGTEGGTLQLAQVWFDVGGRTSDPEAFRAALGLVTPLLDRPDSRGPAAALAAVCHDQLGDLNEAIRCYRIALERFPDQHVLLNNLAYALLRADSSSSEALELVSRAIQAAKSENNRGVLPDYLETLGTALVGLGRLNDAERAFREGIAIAPSNQELLIGLAEVLVALERRDEVPKLLQTAASGPAMQPPLQSRYEKLLATSQNGLR